MMMSYKLFNRKIDLLIDDGNGDGLDLSQFDVSFKVEKTPLAEPNKATISIYNLTATTASQLMKEFKIVTLQAGYEGSYGVIFKGNITRSVFGKPNATDTMLTIECGDGERGYNFGLINKTLAAGATAKDRQAIIAEGLNVEVGHSDETTIIKSSRGSVFFGMAKDFMRKEAKTSKVDVSIQDGVLQFVDVAGTTPTQAVLLSSDTGMIGSPTRGEETITVKSLLNPIFKIGGRVKIDEQGAGLDQFNGTYKILKITFSGETYGNEWYATLVCRDTSDLRIKKKPKAEPKKKTKSTQKQEVETDE
jgi:hypothetical protein